MASDPTVDEWPDFNNKVDDDIQHTVGRLFHVRPQRNNLVNGKPESLQETFRQALQAERNHWKDRLHMSMQEIDRQHRIILGAQSALQEIVKSLRFSLKKNAILEEEEPEVDQGLVLSRLIENIKFQIRQLKLRAGMSDNSKNDTEQSQGKHKHNIVQLKERIAKLEVEKDILEGELNHKTEKITWLQTEVTSLNRQVKKYQSIVARYNASHTGSNFHLNIVETPVNNDDKSPTLMAHNDRSPTTMDLHRNNITPITLPVRERTYIEGDQILSFLSAGEEEGVCKDRLKKGVYSARKSSLRTGVAQCLRCQKLFKPNENNHKACRFHHKGREIKEQYDENGKIKVLYKWACCRKPLDTPGCAYSYHV